MPYGRGMTDASTPPLASVGRRDRRKERTRKALVDAAIGIVNDEGIEAVTVAAVAARADIGFGTFYGYFDRKEDLLRSALQAEFEAQALYNDALAAKAPDAIHRVASAVRASISAIAHRPQWQPLLIEWLLDGGLATRGALFDRLRRDVKDGIDAGVFDPVGTAALPVVFAGAIVAVGSVDVRDRRVFESDAVAHLLQCLGVPASTARKAANSSAG